MPIVDHIEITVKHLHPGAGKTTMEVFDLSGRLMSVLAVEEQGSRVRAV